MCHNSRLISSTKSKGAVHFQDLVCPTASRAPRGRWRVLKLPKKANSLTVTPLSHTINCNQVQNICLADLVLLLSHISHLSTCWEATLASGNP